MLKNIVCGVLIGIANMIPGVSGGTMMVSMGIYDKLIHCITHLFQEFKKSMLYLLPIFIGMGIAIVGSSFGLEYLFEHFPVQTNLLFIGLVLGGLPAIIKRIAAVRNEKGLKVHAGHFAACAVFFAFVVLLALIGEKQGADAGTEITLVNMLKLFGVGIVASATMVIPGVSGSMMLLLMGYYHPILEEISSFIRALTAFDGNGILTGCAVLVPFGVGVIFGIFAIAKLIEILFERFPLYVYWAIVGLILASPAAIVLMGSYPALNAVKVLTGIVCLAAGVFVAVKLGED